MSTGPGSWLAESASARAVLNALPDVVLVLDPETARVVDVNRAEGEVFGYSPDELCALDAAALPVGARGVEVWFDNVDASGCHTYDSNFQRNYGFPVQ